MKTIQPGHEVLSLFGLNQKKAALTLVKNNSLTNSIVSAFLIVLIVGLLLSLAQNALTNDQASAFTVSNQSETVAFVPGQFVTEKISQGYLGN